MGAMIIAGSSPPTTPPRLPLRGLDRDGVPPVRAASVARIDRLARPVTIAPSTQPQVVVAFVGHELGEPGATLRIGLEDEIGKSLALEVLDVRVTLGGVR